MIFLRFSDLLLRNLIGDLHFIKSEGTTGDNRILQYLESQTNSNANIKKTNIKTLELISIEELKKYAIDLS